LRQWQALTTNTLNPPRIEFLDPAGAPLMRRFYRAVRLDASASYEPGIVLLRFLATANDAGVAGVFDAVPLTMAEEIWTSAMQDDGQDPVYCMHTTLPVEEAVRQLTNHPAIAFAQPNYLYSALATANDPKFTDGSLWGMYGDGSSPANLFGSQAAEAWRDGYTGSTDIVLGVIDTGVDINHPDLAANIWVNAREIPGNGVDDDGNGYVDDLHGWDFYRNDNSVFDPDEHYHGTHVAGTMGALGNNGQGVAGVNWRVKIISAKFLGPGGRGSTASALKAVDYLTGLKRSGVNLKAINNSWGGGGYDPALHEAINRAARASLLFVCAAGNDSANNDTSPHYPANYDTTRGANPADYDAVLSVAAINRTGGLAYFSDYGATTVDLGAPGEGVVSCLPNNGYGLANGTSMATPHVTGAVGLYASTHPEAGALQIRNALLGAVAPTASLAGRCVSGGRLDLSTIIRPPPPTNPPVVVNPPANLRIVSATTNSVSLAWDDRSTNEEGFQLERSTNGTAFVRIASPGRNLTAYTDGTVSAGRRYWYRVRAYNSQKVSDWSNVASVTTPAPPQPSVPAAPSALLLGRSAGSQVDLSWQDNSANETGFRLERSVDGGRFSFLANVAANVRGYADTTPVLGRTYSYRVRAFNAVGSSGWAGPASITLPPVSCLVVYVDASYTGAIEDGSAARPFKTLRGATAAACSGAVLNVRAGVYREGALNPGRSMVLQPTGGTVTISR
jgi:subtilisin family serine protease